MNQQPSGKSKAIIAYITFIGMFIAYFMNRDQKHAFATWHIKNMFGLVLILLISQVIQAYVDLLIGEIIWVISFLLWVFSMIMAISNKQKAIPVLSEKFQQWFTFLD
ncbi:hypothetical protein ULVI_11695 [Cochleicola gelatinilyticus]|uniref:Import component protein n=2 Tax=Cochleicola gelatinilyticus TaxID=1763537 RepID=A0A167H296_9FLAO|nr:hypothetical protein ULVI_11695 [Cochleicola gelatinilyticus]